MGSFYSLQIAKAGLFVSQQAIDVTGHNITNADTDGYSRQRLETSSTSGVKDNTIRVGGGVTIDKLTQIRNKYLDVQFRGENSLSNEFELKTDSFEYIEGVMSEPSDYGIDACLDDLYNSLEQLSYNPHELSLREITVQNAVKLTDTFRSISGNLLAYQQEIDKNVSLHIDEINMIAEQIRDINETIFAYENNGVQANDLRDKRGLLLDNLSSMVQITTHENTDGKFSVKMGGIFLVDNLSTSKLEVKPSSDVNQFTGDAVKKVYWEGSNTEVEIKSGKLRALLDIRDGSTKDNQGVAYYLEELNTLAQDIIQGFNDANTAGYTIPHGPNPSVNGIDFFNSDPDNFSALDMKVSDELLDSGYNIAISNSPITGELNWGNNGNYSNFDDLRNYSNIQENLQSVISDIAITTNYYSNRSESQKQLTNHIENQKLAVSEVSIDEEMTNLVQYQHSYSAAAKLISVIDEMLVTLINS